MPANLTDLSVPLAAAEIDALGVGERRARLALMTAAASRGDWSWSYDENLLLRARIPEEKAADDRATAAHNRRADRRLRARR